MVPNVIVMESEIPGDLTIAEYRAGQAKPRKKRIVRGALRRVAKAVRVV